MISVNKNGGLTFFRIGSFGGSFYIKKSEYDKGFIPAVIGAWVSLAIMACIAIPELGHTVAYIADNEAEYRFTACLDRILEATAKDGLTRECRMD